MKRRLALFHSTRAVIRAERLCREHRVSCRVIPVPRQISSECGMSIEYEADDEGALRKLCDEAGIDVSFTAWEKE